MQTVENGDPPLIVNVRGGSQICVPRDLNQAATYVLLEQEDWFEEEIRFVRHWLRPGMQAVDVGANYGVYTVAMAQAVGLEGRVWSFEPTRAPADMLQQTLVLNRYSQVMLSAVAVSDHVGNVAFEITADSELNRVSAAGASSGNVLTVPAVTLDQSALEQGWSGVDFIKIDVEEHESQVIAGGSSFLSENSPLVMLEVQSVGCFESGAFKQLEQMGYEFFRLIPGLLVLAPANQEEQLDSFQLNLFACRQSRAKKLAIEGHLSLVEALAPSKPGNQAWAEYLQSAPYAREIARHWLASPGFLARSDVKAYYDGLASFARSRDTKQSAAERLAWLHRAFARVGEAIEQVGTLPRTVSYARLAWELGLREAAVQSLRQATSELRESRRHGSTEPFLAPSLRSERSTADAAGHGWLECALLEQFEKLRAFSSLYGGKATLSVLEPVFGRPYCAPETERRRQLLRMRTGLQSGPEPHPLLCLGSEENLNPSYWCG